MAHSFQIITRTCQSIQPLASHTLKKPLSKKTNSLNAGERESDRWRLTIGRKHLNPFVKRMDRCGEKEREIAGVWTDGLFSALALTSSLTNKQLSVFQFLSSLCFWLIRCPLAVNQPYVVWLMDHNLFWTISIHSESTGLTDM